MRFVLLAMAAASAVVSISPAMSAPRAQGEARLEQLLEGRVAGTPVRCLNLNAVRSSEIVDRTAIVYRTGHDRLYVNRPRGGAQALDWDDVPVTRPVGSQLCRIDGVRLLDRSLGVVTGFVSLGDFVPYTKVSTTR